MADDAAAHWFARYEADFAAGGPRLIQDCATSLSLAAGAAAVWTAPVPAMIGEPGLWGAAALIAVFAFYQRLSRRLSLIMLPLLLALALACAGLLSVAGESDLRRAALVVLVAATLARLIASPRPAPGLSAFLGYTLVGPARALTALLQRAGLGR